ncbi:hypothetical protein AURDEDRAFT_175820 [Auricularia subglabra TFB-10046 SS5]|uniref:Uncharacterized protein n=1 Tax=Auricularia subglabra (strain TFB-10046 / SS5) TaxID=717982 RepID=J0LE46_AURST|nr:hypothetical protein AURDEDRAFT_175820 [Auricularia subglabra TFB-10046 SS5]
MPPVPSVALEDEEVIEVVSIEPYGQRQTLAIISDNGPVSTFQLSPLIPVKTSTSGGHDSGNAPSNTGGADAPSNTGGANGGNVPGNNGGTGASRAVTPLLRAATSPFLGPVAPKQLFISLPGLRNVTPRTTALVGFKRSYSNIESQDGSRRRNSSPSSKSKASTSRARRSVTSREVILLLERVLLNSEEIRSNWPVLKSNPRKARRILRRYSLDVIDDLWEDWLSSETPPSDDDWATFSRALQAGGRYADEVRAIVKRFCADPALSAALAGDDFTRAELEKYSETLLEHTSLPAERVDTCPKDDLRNALAVSCAFYSAAHWAGLVLHRTVRSYNAQTLTAFVDIVRHAETHSLPFRLGLTLVVARLETDRHAFLSSMHEIPRTVKGVLPLLVHLHVTFPGHLAAFVYGALGAPAPHLRSLSITQSGVGALTPVPIPANLFAGDAERLQTVVLDILTLLPEWERVPAWKRLTIDNDANAPLEFAVDHSAPRPTITSVKQFCASVQYDERLWPNNDCQLNAHFQCLDTTQKEHAYYRGPSIHQLARMRRNHIRTGMVVAVSSTDRSWGIMQYTPRLPKPEIAPSEMLLTLGARLVSLTVDDALLSLVVQTSRAFDALRELFVDCTPARETVLKTNASPLPFPALTCVAMVSTHTAGAPISVRRGKVVALGQLIHGNWVLEELVLSRVKVDIAKELPELFPSVRVEDVVLPAYYHSREDNPRLAT